jgi:hypothetical protein
MEPYESVDAYRRRLLASLHVQPCQDHEVEFDSLQVFVNHECVGTVACDESTQAMAAITQPRPIQTVEVRAATGLLIGSLCAQDLRMKMARIPVGHHVLEISIHNRVDGGSVQVAYQSARPESIYARPPSTQGRAKVAQPSDIPLRRWFPHLIWPNILPVGRAAFVGAVLFLVADRLMDRLAQSPPAAAPPLPPVASVGHESTMSNEGLARQEKVLTQVLQSQDLVTRTILAQAQALTRTHQAIDGLVREQHHLTSQVKQVSQHVAQFKDDARDALEVRAKVDRAFPQTAITLGQTLPQEMGSPIPSQGALAPTLATTSISGIAPSPRGLAALAPFTFLVSFQENTPEKSIQELFQEIHGRSGQINAGWYTVEVDLPQPQTPDIFVDTLKKMKIVKSVSTNFTTTASR